MNEEAPAVQASGYPPYPPYPKETTPPSVAHTIIAGRDLRRKFKYTPQKSVRPPPKPAKPKGPKASDVKISKKIYKAHSRCLRRHGAVLSNRLEYMAKPRRRNIIYLWREHANILPPETIARIRSILDADEPFKPDQAYEYFINLRKIKKKDKKRKEKFKKDMIALCDEERFLWARNATIAFAQGIQQRLSRPGHYALEDGMMQLSNVILDNICELMKMKTPSRNSTNPKARFMMEMSDKIAVWIDKILMESDDRMLMMDFDEDEDIAAADGAGDAGYDEDFLPSMMRGAGGSSSPAYLQFTGDMLEAFTILTNAMFKRGDENLTEYGKFKQSFAEAARLLKETPSFQVKEIISSLVNNIHLKLTDTVKELTPDNLQSAMREIIDICSLFLAENADLNKHKGPAFKLLIRTMNKKPNVLLFDNGQMKQTCGEAAIDLIQARGLDSDHDDPNLTTTIQSNLVKLVDGIVEPDMRTDMDETIDVCSKYLSQNAIDKVERGPAFELLIKTLVESGGEAFIPQYEDVETKFAAAHALETAPGLTSLPVNEETKPEIEEKLHKAVDLFTPKPQQEEMDSVVERGANYLSGYIRDRAKALKLLLETMKKNASKELAKRNDYFMTYGAAADEIEKSPVMVPYLPVKDIKEEIEKKLERDVAPSTPASLKIPMKSLVRDVAEVLSQPIALKSDAAGKRYPMDLLIAVKKAQGALPLYEYKGYKETYANAADTLKKTVTTEDDVKNERLKDEIATELNTTLPPKLLPTIASEIQKPVEEASHHLATIGTKRGDALEHITGLMKEKGDVPLARLQGYEQTYSDAARRISDAPTLVNEKVDKKAYPKVKDKIKELTEEKPAPAKIDKEQLTEMVDQTAKFLAAPIPEVESEKRRLLADLMGREGDKKLAQEGIYKVTFKEGANEVMKAPATPFKAQDEELKSDLKDKVTSVLPDKDLETALSDTVKDAAGNLASIVKGRGEVIQLIYDGMKKEKEKPLVDISGEVVHLIQDHMKKDKDQPLDENNPHQNTHTEADEKIKDEPTSNRHGDQPNRPLFANNPAIMVMQMGAAKIMKDAPTSTRHADQPNKSLFANNPGVMVVHTEAAGKIKVVPTLPARTSHVDRPDKPLASIDQYQKTHIAAAEMIKGAPTLTTDTRHVDPVLMDTITESVKKVPISVVSPEAKEHMEEGVETVSKYLASVAAKEIAERKFKSAGPGPGSFSAKKMEMRGKPGANKSAAFTDPNDHHDEALQLLHDKLKARGDETFYKQPRNELTYGQASEWLTDKPFDIDKSLRNSGDTGRLNKKFERKLSSLVGSSTSPVMQDAMQDVIIESSRELSELFMTKNYSAMAQDAVISEMQKRGSDGLIEEDGNTETYFYAAQRLKKTNSLETDNPIERNQHHLSKKLDEMIKSRNTLRKLSGHIKDYVQNSSKYLSKHVNIPDKEINAYIALLAEMEAAGDRPLVEGKIKKSYKDAADYLRELTTFDDEINREDKSLQKDIDSKLHSLVDNVATTGYDKADMKNVIERNAKLFTSYVKQQDEKTDALKVLVEEMDKESDNVLLRHGTLRKTYRDGANILRPKNADQLKVANADPVVLRKIQIKLQTLMHQSFNKYKEVMGDVVQDATSYLAVHFLQPEIIKICKCMKHVCVQCELWTNGILRHMAKRCTCSRHGRIDVCPSQLYLSANGLLICNTGLQVTISRCLSKRNEDPPLPCPASKPSTSCKSHDSTAAYLLATTHGPFDNIPTKLTDVDSQDTGKATRSLVSRLDSIHSICRMPSEQEDTYQTSASVNTVDDILGTNSNISDLTHTTLCETEPTCPYGNTIETMPAQANSPICATKPIDEVRSGLPKRHLQSRNVFSTSTPIVTTVKLSDWHSMMVSLMWNVHAWRVWIQDNIEKLLAFQERNELNDTWMSFQIKATTETMQWNCYYKFSQQIISRTTSNYNNKKIVSSTGTTVKPKLFLKSHSEMLEIIDQFNRWTDWLTVSIKETDKLLRCKDPTSERWRILKEKVNEHFEEWINYDSYLTFFWEIKFKSQISDWVCGWQQPGPVWVESACGAVPSGSVAAGLNDGEVIWVARTTHNRKVLPAALYPSKHCCVLYWGGKAHHYTKYQVMCNASVQWLAWRAGPTAVGAVRVGDTFVGRVQYRSSHLLGPVVPPLHRCYVLMFGRQVAFQCYELLVADGT